MNDGYPRDISTLTSNAAGFRQTDKGYIKVQGCGMDMGFHIVYSLASALYRLEGFGVLASDKTCRPSNREEAVKMVSQGIKFWGRNGDTSGWDNDGGYALAHRWL